LSILAVSNHNSANHDEDYQGFFDDCDFPRAGS